MSEFPFQSVSLAPNLTPNPPGEIPAPFEAGNAAPPGMSPFAEPQDINQIITQLTLDRPLKLFIPNKEKYPDFEFRIINSIPSEIADARNKGWKEITDPELTKLFVDLVAGTDKEGKAYRPLLYSRPKVVGGHIRNERRKQLASVYAGMDPKNKEVGGKYTSAVDAKDGTFLAREGAPWRIKLSSDGRK